MPLFYYLPKVHKPPRRPIITGIGSLTNGLSHYIDLHLQKHVNKLKSYLRETSSIIQELTDIKWQPEYRWTTLDVASLYSNIPHKKDISAIRHLLSTDDEMPENQKNFYSRCYQLHFENTTSEFNEQIYIQTRGTAMGTRFAPSFANLYIGLYETLYVINEHQWRKNIIIYKRYVDDLLFIWQGSDEDFKLFTGHLNNNDWGQIFTGTINPK